MSEKIRVVIVDDHPLFREGVATILGNEPDFEVVGQGATADEAIQLSLDLLPELLLIDIDMPGNGITAARAVAAACPVTRIIFLTVSEADENLVAALKAGGRAYILKGVAGRELVRILRAVYEGESYVPPALAASLLVDLSEARKRTAALTHPMEELTERERQILELLGSGLSNKEIAGKLFLSEKTVKHYMTNILQKLQVRNRVEAALLAQKTDTLHGDT
jgi:DNA-binding NarL/FixJ family response regulator